MRADGRMTAVLVLPRAKHMNKPLRIAVIGVRGVPSHYSGIEKAAESLYSRLAHRGHQITLYCRREYQEAAGSEYRGIELRRIPCIGHRALEAVSHAGLGLLDAALLTRPDVVHLHALAPGLFAAPVRLMRVPMVATIHGLDWQRSKWKGAGAKVLRFAERQIMRHVKEVIVVSQDLHEYYAREYGRRTHYIPNGVERTTVIGGSSTLLQFGLRPQEYVLYAGRLVPEKSVETLIAAFREIETTHKLVIAGEGRYAGGYVAALRVMAKTDSRVLFTGLLKGQPLHEIVANAAVVVQPSLLEGLPLSLLESMERGLPCIASDIAPHRQLLGTVPGYDLFFPPANVRRLSARVRAVLESPGDHITAARHAQEHVRSAYDWDLIAQQTETILFQAAGRRVLSSAQPFAAVAQNHRTPEA